MKTWKSWLLLSLAGMLMVFLLILVGIASFYYGRFRGFQEATIAQQNKMAQQTLARPFVPPPHGKDRVPTASKTHGITPPADKSVSVPAQNPFGLPEIKGDEEDLSAQMSQLEQLMGKLAPGEDGEVTIAPETLALVKKGKEDSAKAIDQYFQDVQVVLSATQGVSSQELAAGLQSGDEKTYDQAITSLKKSYQTLLGMKVPPRCADLHASYLTLIPDLVQLFDMQKRATAEADTALLLEALGKAKHVMALQKSVQQKEKALKGALKG